MLFKFFTFFLDTSICETSLGGLSGYLLFVKCCSTLFSVLFRNTHSMKHYFVAAPSSHPEVFCKTSTLKNVENMTEKHLRQGLFLVKFQVKNCNFIKKRLPHRCFPVKYAKFILQNTSGGINKKRRKVHKQRLLLKIIYYHTTG